MNDIVLTLVDQKVVEPPERGDCMIACVLSVLRQPYDAAGDALRDLMDKIVERKGDWLTALDAYAIGMGYRLKWATAPQDVPPGVYTIAGGPSPRGCKAGHAVVMRGAGPDVRHDPHPSRAGLSGEPDTWWWFEPITAAEASA